MSDDSDKWHYFDIRERKWTGPVALSRLDALFETGTIFESTEVVSNQMVPGRDHSRRTIKYSQIARIPIVFQPVIETLYDGRKGKPVTVLCGPNNCGKTLLLKQLCLAAGEGAHIIGANRFSHVSFLNTRESNNQEFEQMYGNFVQTFFTAQQNTEDNSLNLEKIITGLTNPQRSSLFKLAHQLLGNTFELKRMDADRDFSPFYVDMDGQNLRYGSSGTRLLLTLLGTMMLEKFRVLLIDEPEIGLSPRIQAALAAVFYNAETRKEYFPYLQELFISTHSHLFLDRGVLSNNFAVSKQGMTVGIGHITSLAEFHHLQFNLLGNSFESLFMPSLVVIVEGDSEIAFLTRVVQLHLPNRQVAIVNAGGDGGTLSKLNVLANAFGDIQASPYRDRLFVILDSVRSVRTDRIEKQGVRPENIISWKQNGIEYLYPPRLVAEAFSCSVEDVDQIDRESNAIEWNGLRRTKLELAAYVAAGLTPDDELGLELTAVLTAFRAAAG